LTVPVILPVKPSLQTASEDIKELAQVVKKAEHKRDRIEFVALKVGELAKLAGFKYEEAETKLPCRMGFETYCHERIREADRAQKAAKIAAANATAAIDEANTELDLLHKASEVCEHE
jgi:hypothetical protein